MAKLAAGHERGAANGLRAAADGLLEAAPGSAAAAQRPGKPVEINALWHNALATLAELGTRLGDTAQAKLWAESARRVQRRFAELFWHAEEGCLYDSVRAAGASDGDDAGQPAAGDDRDPALRGHQVLAIGLPFPALSKQRGQRLLRTLEERLYTPVGLRDGGGAPSPRRSETGGAGAGRPDLAWPWLLGPFLAAQQWLRGAAGRRQALQLLAELDPHLATGIVGTIAELVGAEPPHLPAGHGAHAASVGELLRVYVAVLRADPAPPRTKPPRPRKAAAKSAGASSPRPRRARSPRQA